MRPARLLPVIAVIGVVVAALIVAATPGRDDASDAARVERITESLRCPTCEGLSVADSPSATARAIRDDVGRRVAAGETDERVKQAYVDRYGEWILLRPRSTGFAALLWAVPVAVLVGAAAMLAWWLRRVRAEPLLSPSEADRQLVGQALAERSARDQR